MRLPRLAAAAAVLSLATILVGCGEDSSPAVDQSPEAPATFDADDLETAMLRVEDVGEDFRRTRDGSGSDDSMGCLAYFDEIDDEFEGSDESAEVQISADNDDDNPEVYQLLSWYEDEDDAERALENLKDELEVCTGIRRSEDGVTIDLDVTSDQDETASGVDEQFNLDADGVLSTPNGDFELALRARFFRVGNVLSGLSLSSMHETGTNSEAAALVDIAVARIQALLAGEEQPEPASVDLEPFEARQRS